MRAKYQADLTSIFFAGFWASAVFGNVIVSTPLEKSDLGHETFDRIGSLLIREITGKFVGPAAPITISTSKRRFISATSCQIPCATKQGITCAVAGNSIRSSNLASDRETSTPRVAYVGGRSMA
jgi:hypothetical protein